MFNVRISTSLRLSQPLFLAELLEQLLSQFVHQFLHWHMQLGGIIFQRVMLNVRRVMQANDTSTPWQSSCGMASWGMLFLELRPVPSLSVERRNNCNQCFGI